MIVNHCKREELQPVFPNVYSPVDRESASVHTMSVPTVCLALCVGQCFRTLYWTVPDLLLGICHVICSLLCLHVVSLNIISSA